MDKKPHSSSIFDLFNPDSDWRVNDVHACGGGTIGRDAHPGVHLGLKAPGGFAAGMDVDGASPWAADTVALACGAGMRALVGAVIYIAVKNR